MEPTARILLVDDEPHVTANIRTALRKQPWEIREANSGQMGLELAGEHRFDVIVSDEQMPGMSGAEFLSRVAEQSPETIRIILSGQGSLDTAIRAINEAGIYRFLTKPCESEELLACLTGAVEASKAARAAAIAALSLPEQVSLFDRPEEVLESLSLVFQPIVLSQARKNFGYEALCRSGHPDIPHPGVLFDAGEAAGRTLEIEARIRHLIGESLVSLPPDAQLFVNLHPNTLDDESFYHETNPLFAAPDRIVLEVTERASLDGITDLQQKICSLKDRGFKIAVDDLGAGYAGLNTFALLQPDIVKLDIDLIRGIDASSTNQRVVSSMVRLGQEIDFLSVAEGIENEQELRTLIDLGCDLLQGFLLARPAKSFTLPVWPKGEEEPTPE